MRFAPLRKTHFFSPPAPQPKVTAADGSSTIARDLIDSRSSASFVLERLAQHLRLYRVQIKTQDWKGLLEQVSWAEDDAGKVGVYVLKKGSTPASYSRCPQVGRLMRSKAG